MSIYIIESIDKASVQEELKSYEKLKPYISKYGWYGLGMAFLASKEKCFETFLNIFEPIDHQDNVAYVIFGVNGDVSLLMPIFERDYITISLLLRELQKEFEFITSKRLGIEFPESPQISVRFFTVQKSTEVPL